MRILQINSVYGYGSTGRIVQNLHQAIKDSGNESFVIHGRGKISSDPNVFKIGNALEQGIDLLATRLFNRHGQTNFVSTKKMINKIEELKPDVVHLHNLHGYYVNYVKLLKYLKNTNIKVVWLLHDPWIISGSSADEGGLGYDWEGKIDKDKLISLSREYPIHSRWSSKRSIRNYEVKKALLSDNNIQFVTPSKWLADEIKFSFLEGSKVDVIYNGIDINQFRYFEKKYDSESIQILGVASVWGRTKGLAYFNRLAQDLDKDYSITLVGISPEQKKNLNPNIRCIERTDSIDDLVELYNMADVFVNPTLFDNFPTVNLEAQACGTPVITFDTGGSAESITDNTGKKVERGNYKQLLEIIKKINKKTDIQSRTCRENAMKYSVSNMESQFKKIYSIEMDKTKVRKNDS